MDIILICKETDFDQKFLFITFLNFKSIPLVLGLTGSVCHDQIDWYILLSGFFLQV